MKIKFILFLFLSFAFTLSNGQTTNPLQSLNYTVTGQDYNWNYNLGYRFTADAAGDVTQLGGRWRDGVVHTVRLYDYTGGGTLLASANVTGSMGWNYANLATPVTLIQGRQYVVAVRVDAQSSGMYTSSISLPAQSGSITINNATYLSGSNAMPTNSVTNTMYGQADITFQPCNNGGSASISTTALCAAGTVDLSLVGQSVGSSIQWQQSTGGAFTDVAGATTANYTTTTLSPTNTYSFRAEVTNGCSSYSDTVSVYVGTGGTNGVPNYEGLETSFGVWTNSTADNNDWIRNSGGTPSNSTGPSAAAGGSQYAFVEASNPNFNSTAILEADFDFTGIIAPELSFDYHMYGADMGSLSVLVNGTSVWTVSGQQHASNTAAWSNHVIDLSSYANLCYVNIQFVNNTGASYRSDIGLDNINLTDPCAVVAGNASVSSAALCSSGTVDLSLTGNGAGAIQWQQSTGGTFTDIAGATTANVTTGTLTPTNTYLFRAKVTVGCSSYSDTVSVYVGTSGGSNSVPNLEDLEASFGIWSNSTADNNDWIRNSGGTPSNSTGPSAAAGGSQYAFVEASNPNFNSTAILEADFDFTGIATPELSFDYHMYGADMGSLSVVVNGTTVWNVSGQQHASNGAAWSNQVLDLSAYANSCYVNIQFINNTGSNYRSDIGLDNINIINKEYVWTGATSTDWATGTNWNSGSVPGASASILVPDVINQPVLDQNRVIGSLTIEASADADLNGFELTLEQGFINDGNLISNNGTLKFNGSTDIQYITANVDLNLDNLTIDNTNGVTLSTGSINLQGTLTLTNGVFNTGGNLTVLSNPTGTGRIAEITGGSITGNVTMQRYIDAGSTDWRFLTSAISGTTLADFNDDFVTSGFIGSDYPDWPSVANRWPSIYFYDESVAGIQDNGYVAAANITDPLAVGEGIWVWSGDTSTGTQPFTIDVTGTINTGNINLPVTYTNSGNPSDDGWNMVGNPYPSTLDWDDASITKTNINNAIYIWNPDLQQFASYVAGFGINGGSKNIASSQAFWVQATSAGASIQVTEASKTSVDASFLKVAQPSLLSIVATNGFGTDQTIVNFNPNATNGFDGMYDALKLGSVNTDLPSISTVMNDSVAYSINQLSESGIELPLKLTSSTSGIQNIVFNGISEFDEFSCIILEDLFTGLVHDLRSDSAITVFISDATTTARFLLKFGAVTTTTVTDVSCFAANDAKIVFKNNGVNTFDIAWKDNQGNTIVNNSNIMSGDSIANLSSGVYNIETVDGICGVINQTVTVTEPAQITPLFTTTNVTATTIDFNNQTSNATTYFWDFGDGNTSTATNPTNTYLSNGVYTVYLTAYQSATCFKVYDQQVNTVVTAIDQLDNNSNISAWINNKQLIVKGEQIENVVVRNVLGQTLFTSYEKQTFNLNDIAPQTLIVIVKNNAGFTSTKLQYTK